MRQSPLGFLVGLAQSLIFLLQVGVDAYGNSGDDERRITDHLYADFFARDDVSARYLPVLIFHDDSFACTNLRMQRNICNVNVVARLDKRVLCEGGSYVVFGENFCSVRTRNAAAYVDVAPGDFRAVD